MAGSYASENHLLGKVADYAVPLCIQSIDSQTNGLARAEKASILLKSLNNPFTFYTKICYN